MTTRGISSTCEIIMPSFWITRPEAWFRLLESNFRRCNITCEWKKFCHALMYLDAKTLKCLRRLMEYHPHYLSYNMLKRELIRKFKKGKKRARNSFDPRQRRHLQFEYEYNMVAGDSDVDMNGDDEASETVTDSYIQTSNRSISHRKMSARSRTRPPINADLSDTTEDIDELISMASATREAVKTLRVASRAIRNIFRASRRTRSRRRSHTLRHSAAGTSTQSTAHGMRSAGSSAQEDPIEVSQSSIEVLRQRQAELEERILSEMYYYIDYMVDKTKRNARRSMEDGTWGEKILRWANVIKTLSHPDYDPTLLRSVFALCEDDPYVNVRQPVRIRGYLSSSSQSAIYRRRQIYFATAPLSLEQELE